MDDKSEFKDAKRELESILAPLEKKSLLWLAQRMPSRVNSDHLTLLGLAAMIFAGLFYYLGKWQPLCLLFMIFLCEVEWSGLEHK